MNEMASVMQEELSDGVENYGELKRRGVVDHLLVGRK